MARHGIMKDIQGIEQGFETSPNRPPENQQAAQTVAPNFMKRHISPQPIVT